MAIDTNFSSVGLLLHLDGENGSTSVTDFSATPKTVSVVGGAHIATAVSHSGGAALELDGTGDYLSVPSHADFRFDTGDFTIELWLKTTGADKVVLDYYTAAQPGWQLSVTATGKLLWYTTATIKTGVTTVNDDNPHHIAIVRTSGSLQFYVDGVADGSAVAHSTNLNYATSVLGIGAQVATRSTAYDLPGVIDEVRITKGVARYSTTFTPSTEAYPNADHEIGTAAIYCPAPTLVAHCGAAAFPVCPSPIFYAGLIATADAELVAPSATLVASCGGYAILDAPSPTLQSAGHDAYGDQAAFLTAPSPTLTAYCGGHSALTAPSPVLTVTATVVSLATAALTAPSPTVTATGVVTQTAAASLSAPIGTLIGYSGAVCSITVGCGTITATGTTGSVGHAALTCPLFELAASATAQNHGSALLTAPSGRLVTGAQAYLVAPSATLTAIGTAVVTATYEAYALNLNHSSDTNDELTHYTNFPFTHVVRYKNSYYGANSTGLYLLEGTTDDGVAIDWSFKTGMTDFDSPQNKTVTYAYFGGRLGPDATVSIYPGEPTGTSYSYTTPRGQYAQNYRQKFGKGLKARYFAIGASGSDVLELDSIDLTVATLTRRI